MRSAPFLLFVLAPLTLAAASCGLHLTTAERNVLVSAEQTACALIALDHDIPQGFEAWACAAAQDATKALPASETAVRAKVAALAAAPPVAVKLHEVGEHGKVLDRRSVMGVSFPVDGGAEAGKN